MRKNIFPIIVGSLALIALLLALAGGAGSVIALIAACIHLVAAFVWLIVMFVGAVKSRSVKQIIAVILCLIACFLLFGGTCGVAFVHFDTVIARTFDASVEAARAYGAGPELILDRYSGELRGLPDAISVLWVWFALNRKILLIAGFVLLNICVFLGILEKAGKKERAASGPEGAEAFRRPQPQQQVPTEPQRIPAGPMSMTTQPMNMSTQPMNNRPAQPVSNRAAQPVNRPAQAMNMQTQPMNMSTQPMAQAQRAVAQPRMQAQQARPVSPQAQVHPQAQVPPQAQPVKEAAPAAAEPETEPVQPMSAAPEAAKPVNAGPAPSAAPQAQPKSKRNALREDRCCICGGSLKSGYAPLFRTADGTEARIDESCWTAVNTIYNSTSQQQISQSVNTLFRRQQSVDPAVLPYLQRYIKTGQDRLGQSRPAGNQT